MATEHDDIDNITAADLVGDVAENEADQQAELGDADGDGEPDGAPPPPMDPVERLARAGGWKPESEWKGDKTNWTPAEQFVADRLDRAERTSKQLRRVEADVARVTTTQARIAQQHREQALSVARQAMRDAVETGDIEAAEKAMEDALRPAPAEAASAPPAVREFETRNAGWFGVNDEATAYAELVDRRLAAKLPEGQRPDPELHMKRVEEAVFTAFPKLRPTIRASVDDPKPREAAPVVARGNRAPPPRGAKRTAADLPPEARKAAQQLIAAGMVKTVEDYATEYWKDQAA